MNILQTYLRVSLIKKLIIAFVLGAAIGGVLWYASVAFGMKDSVHIAMRYVAPFGTVFINMLKMIVIPVIFFSLVVGSSSLALDKLGKVGGKVILWYFSTMFIAAILGVVLASFINPGSGSSFDGWQKLSENFAGQASEIVARTRPESLIDILEGLLFGFFKNPFAALANADFLGVIVFSILFGISLRVVLENSKDSKLSAQVQLVIDFFQGANAAIAKIIDFVLQYSPIGVFFLAMVIFAVSGSSIIGPYVSVTLGVILGIFVLMFIVYPFLIFLFTKQNPYKIIYKAREAMLMAFVTRSSGATLPVSLKISTEEMKVQPQLASFSLPLGATINMDGVCIHLPMFAILAANMFGVELSFASTIIMVITTVLAAVGTGGVPGGSLMLLFIILDTIGLSASQTAVIVALATGINPILDMFETMNNVTGDILFTYVVAKRENLVEE